MDNLGGVGCKKERLQVIQTVLSDLMWTIVQEQNRQITL